MGRYVAVGTADGVAASSATEKYPNRVVYDVPGTYTFTVPTGVKKIRATTIGGGGPGYEGYEAVEVYDTHHIGQSGRCSDACTARTPTADPNVQCTLCCQPLTTACVAALTTCTQDQSAGYIANFYCTCSGHWAECWCEMIQPCCLNNDAKLHMVAYGGASGGYAHKEIDVVEGTSYNVIVGGPSQTSSFGTEVSATGATLDICRQFNRYGCSEEGPTCIKNPNCTCAYYTTMATCIQECVKANTANPQFFDATCFLPMSGVSSQCAFHRAYLSYLCWQFIKCLAVTPGQGVGGDVNKTGSTGNYITYTTEMPTDKMYSVYPAQAFAVCLCGCVYHPIACQNLAAAAGCNICRRNDVVTNNWFNTSDCYWYGSTSCVDGQTTVCCCQNTHICCAPKLIWNDTRIGGASAPTEYYDAGAPTYEIGQVKGWQAPFDCQCDFRSRWKIKPVSGPNACDITYCHNWIFCQQCICSTATACAGQWHDGFQVTMYRFDCDDAYQDFLSAYYRFTPHREIQEILWCCDGYTYSERRKSKDLKHRITFTCMCHCASVSMAAASSNTELVLFGTGDEQYMAPTCMIWDRCRDYFTCCCNHWFGYMGTDMNGPGLVAAGVTANTAQGGIIAQNTYNRYYGNWDKLRTEGVACYCLRKSDCIGANNAQDGYACTYLDLSGPAKISACLTKNFFTNESQSGTSGFIDMCDCSSFGKKLTCNYRLATYGEVCALCFEGISSTVVNTYDCGGSMFISANNPIPPMKIAHYYNRFTPASSGDDLCIMNDWRCNEGALPNFGGANQTGFACTTSTQTGRTGITETCYKDCYFEAGQGGYSSWWENCAKGNPGLVVVCY